MAPGPDAKGRTKRYVLPSSLHRSRPLRRPPQEIGPDVAKSLTKLVLQSGAQRPTRAAALNHLAKQLSVAAVSKRLGRRQQRDRRRWQRVPANRIVLHPPL